MSDGRADFLAEAVDVRRWLEADSDASFSERTARDRAIGRSITARDALDRIHLWWLQVRSESDSERSVGQRLHYLERLATLLLLVGGVIFGVGVGSLAFAFDGSYPVNLLALLGVLVGIPALLLLITLILLIPGGLPGLGALHDAFSVVNPGRWVAAWLDRFSGLSLYGGFHADQSRFARWQLVVFSQWLALGYFIGVLLAGWVLVAVTDLAFGWSTTLTLDASSVHGLFDALASPWRSWLPQAAPAMELVEASRFYRLETDSVSSARAVQLGQWWPFVLMTVLVWGLAPRVLLLAAGRWRRAVAARILFLQDPEVVALLDRLAVPHVDFGDQDRIDAASQEGAAQAPPESSSAVQPGLVLWNDALTESKAQAWLREHLGSAAGSVARVAVWMPDAEVRAQLARFEPAPERLIVITKGWEPPLLEFADFLSALREQVDSTVTLIVLPINTRGDGVDTVDREVWAGFLARHPDPRLYVLQATGSEET